MPLDNSHLLHLTLSIQTFSLSHISHRFLASQFDALTASQRDKKNFQFCYKPRRCEYQRRNVHLRQSDLFSSVHPLCFGCPFPQYTHLPRLPHLHPIYRFSHSFPQKRRVVYSFSSSERIFSPLARAASMSPTTKEYLVSIEDSRWKGGG